MNVALDSTPLTIPTGGIRRYVEQLVAALRAEYPRDRFVLMPDHARQSWIDRRWWLLGVNRAIEQNKVDLFHGTDFSVPKGDPVHRAPSFVYEDAVRKGSRFLITGADGTQRLLIQLPGGLNTMKGRYEFIYDFSLGKVTHQMFVKNGAINGIPIKP